MLDFELADRMACGMEERIDSKELIVTLIRLANIARREGILALEDEAGHVKEKLLKEGLILVVDGTDPEIVEKIMDHYIMASGCRGKELLRLIIQKEGVLNIQQGVNPRILEKLLCSFLGFDVRAEIEDYIRQSEKECQNVDKLIQAYLLEVRNKEATVKEEECFQCLAADKGILHRLAGSAHGVSLAMALICASGWLQICVLNNISRRNAAALVKELREIQAMELPEGITLEELSSRAQADVVRTIKRLEENGEIVQMKLFRDAQFMWHKSMMERLRDGEEAANDDEIPEY